MVEVPLDSEAGFQAAVGKDCWECIENRDPQKDQKGGTLIDQGKRRKKLTEKGVSFKL